MDDVPAGPASPEPRRPSLSVVVPVFNGGSDFKRCLRRLRDSSWTDYELIVVDDRMKGKRMVEGGKLADVAPTALHMMGLEKPKEMTGASLLKKK